MKILFGIFLCLGFLSACREKAPVILSIEPRIGHLGDLLTIQGSGFGNERNESFVSIAGIPPTSSSYISWNDQEIRVRVPEFGEAGLVYVHRGRNRSNPALFANQLIMPIPAEGPDTANGPRITSIEPGAGPIGTLITIHGSGFGSSRENSGIFFTWDSDPSTAGAGIIPASFVEAFEAEFGYELWSDREIRVRVPDGAVSGNLVLRSPRGNSRSQVLEINGKPGTKSFLDRRTYTISYAVNFKVDRAANPNALYIWMPQPMPSASQRNVRLISRSMEPLVENHRGTSLFHLVNNPSGANREINLSYTVEVYTVETEIRSQAPVRLNSASPIVAAYTRASVLVPSDHPDIRAMATQIIGREQQPYARARLIYQWLISSLDIQAVPRSGNAIEALEEMRADSYQATLLFCALARAANIPALPLAGVLVDRQSTSIRHFWAEFWLDGFGWIPLDPALGAGSSPTGFNLIEDHAQYYFGNMDNQRIAFSRGEMSLARMSPHGITVSRDRDFSLQDVWEEAVGALESYSSLWSDVTITGMYVY